MSGTIYGFLKKDILDWMTMRIKLSELAQAAEKTTRLAASATRAPVTGVYSYAPGSKFKPDPQVSPMEMARLRTTPYGIK